MKFISYLFNYLPGSQFKFYIPMIILSLFLIVGGAVFSEIYKRKKREDFAFKRLFTKVAGRSVGLGIFFLILTAVRYENIPYFAMRIWIYLGLLLLAYAIFHYVRIYLKIYPIEKINAAKKPQSEQNKYLPNKG